MYAREVIGCLSSTARVVSRVLGVVRDACGAGLESCLGSGIWDKVLGSHAVSDEKNAFVGPARPRSSGIVQETGRPRMRPRFAAHPQCKDDVPCGLLEHVVVGGSDQAAIRT